jgi:hypothetical protein
LDFVLQHGNEPKRTVQLRTNTAFIMPRGTWHREIVRSPYVMLSITYGAGTQHRPL